MKWEKPKVIQHGSCKIVIHRPILTKQERSKREDQIKASLESAMRTYTQRKEIQSDIKNASRTI
jgi:Lon protease-like protein